MLSLIVRITAFLLRVFVRVDFKKLGLKLLARNIPRGMYKDYFSLDFSSILNQFSNRKVDVTAYNCFVMGNFDKENDGRLKNITNFLDPTSKFKDSWFGLYLIADDDTGKGKRFILKDPSGDPAAVSNFNRDAVLKIPELDQKCIVFNSHEGQKDYPYEKFDKDFFFTRTPGTMVEEHVVLDNKGRQWLKLEETMDTISALTDKKITKMKLIDSIRSYTGLPDERVYSLVDPWHPITLAGVVLMRYFIFPKMKFWAMVYYNGVSFTTKQGKLVDTWKNSDIEELFFKAFKSFVIEAV